MILEPDKASEVPCGFRTIIGRYTPFPDVRHTGYIVIVKRQFACCHHKQGIALQKTSLFIILLQYHGTGVLASNKKTVLHIVSFNFNLLIELLDKIKMKNYPTW
jgi:hypothetical protein